MLLPDNSADSFLNYASEAAEGFLQSVSYGRLQYEHKRKRVGNLRTDYFHSFCFKFPMSNFAPIQNNMKSRDIIISENQMSVCADGWTGGKIYMNPLIIPEISSIQIRNYC